MVIKGKARGNPKQASFYLLDMKDNEAIRILEDGQGGIDADSLHQSVYVMGISAELSKSEKGLYHTQINPAPGEDKLMNDERWQQAADILGKQLNLENQRRVIVLHTKKGRTHAHVMWERFDHAKGIMVSDSFSRLAQDRARKEMELTFGHVLTPHRNKHRPELKENLTRIWHETSTGREFIAAMKAQGYLVSEGSGRDPFMVIDEFARSHNLPRQIKGARLKDVRERLRHEQLMTEKQAIEKARSMLDSNERDKQRGEQGKRKIAYEFKQSKDTIIEPDKKHVYAVKFKQFKDNDPTPASSKQREEKLQQIAGKYKEAKDAIIEPAKSEPEIDPRRKAFRERMAELDREQQKKKGKDKGLEYD